MPCTNQEIASNIRALAEKRGVTVKQLLEECGINRNFIYDLERGNSSPSVDKISKLAEYLGVSTARIIDGENGEVAALLAIYETLSPEAKKELRTYMQSLTQP